MGFSPATMATASMIGQIGGAVSSAAGSYYGAAVQKINLESQARMAEVNARIAEMGAQSALNQGHKQAASLTLRAGQMKSTQRAAMAANGIDLGEGSAAEVQASTDTMKDIDQNQILANAVQSAWGYRMQGVNHQNEALMARADAKGIKPGMDLATSLLGSATSIASSWYAMRQVGALGQGSDIARANQSSDPIYALGTTRGWF